MSASRSASRALIDFTSTRSSAYVCRSCRRTLQRSFSTAQPRQAANEEIPFTEKVRRKIWGTDNPPGLKDPYGGPSFLERRRMEREARARADEDHSQPKSQLDIAADNFEKQVVRTVSEDYTPAETWAGLEHVGHVGEWQDMEEAPTEIIEHFLPPPHTQQPPSFEDLSYAMSRAIFECSILHGTPNTSALSLPTDPEAYPEILSNTPILLDAHNKIQGLDIPQEQKAHLAQNLLDASTTDYTPTEPEKEQQIPTNEAWLNARLNFTSPLTFQILARFTLLSRVRIPDPVLTTHLNSPTSSIETLLRGIHSRLVKTSRTKLADKLKQSDKLAGVGNVVVFPRRESQIDKEKELGRWKVIERELRERGLPLVQGGIKVEK